MMKTRFKLLKLSASLLACGIVSSQVQATPVTPAHPFDGAYAFAYNHITNGQLTVVGGVATLGVSSSQTSTSGTPLPITRASDNAVGPLPDPLPATQGAPVRLNETIGGSPATTDTGYTQTGPTGTNYSWSDARITSEQTVSGSLVDAWNAAEGYLASNGNATSQASNGSTSALVFTVALGAPGTIAFEFKANPYMEINLGANAKFPLSKAEANLDLNVSIRDAGTGALVFSWSPDGTINAIGGTVGGTELFDDEDLNGSIGTILPGNFGHFSDNGGAFSDFSAISNLLGAGIYELTLSMNESQNVRLDVPEPATLALMGLGLFGVGFSVRRRKQV